MGRLNSLSLVWQPVLKKENSEFKPLVLHLRNYHSVVYPACNGVIGDIYIYHDDDVLLARIYQNRHSSLSSITLGRSSRLHSVSVQSCCRFLAGHPTPACPYEGVLWWILLMSSSVLLQQGPTSLVCLIWMVLEMGGRWLYSCCFVGCWF